MSDARDRRRARAQEENKTHPMEVVKRLRVPLIIGVIWLALVGYQVAAAQGLVGEGGPDCPGHWHAGYDVVIDGQSLSFRHPDFADQATSPAAGMHLHNGANGDPNLIHMHPGAPRCIETSDILAKLGLDVSADRIVVDGHHVEEGSYEQNATHVVEVHHRPWQGDWRVVDNVGSFMEGQLHNGDQLLIVYRAVDEDVGPLREQTRSLEGDASYEPQATGGWSTERSINVTVATVFAGLAIMIWRKFTASA